MSLDARVEDTNPQDACWWRRRELDHSRTCPTCLPFSLGGKSSGCTWSIVSYVFSTVFFCIVRTLDGRHVHFPDKGLKHQRPRVGSAKRADIQVIWTGKRLIEAQIGNSEQTVHLGALTNRTGQDMAFDSPRTVWNCDYLEKGQLQFPQKASWISGTRSKQASCLLPKRESRMNATKN